MSIQIAPLSEPHFEALHSVLDTVARERRYLAFTQAPPREAAFAFYQRIVDKGLCHFIALEHGAVIGWCDVLPTPGEARAHVGTLGIGLLPTARGRGIGTQLMEAAIARAWQGGFTRIELTVRTDNASARALYERLGFKIEGVLRQALRFDGDDHDAYAMALLR